MSGVRNAFRAPWLLFFLVLLGSSVLVRAIRTPWLAAAIVIAIVALLVAYTWFTSRSRHATPKPVTKNITPVEPKLAAGPNAPPDRAPDVVVIDAESPFERLEAKLEALDRLHAKGVVSDAEYETKRAKLIADL